MLIFPLGQRAAALLAALEDVDAAAEAGAGVVDQGLLDAVDLLAADLVSDLRGRADDIASTLVQLRDDARRTREAARQVQLRAQRRDALADRMWQTVQTAMEASGIERLSGDRHTLAVQAVGGSLRVEVPDEDAVPADWRKVGPPDTGRIRAALEAGEVLGWASLAPRGRSLRVRT